MKIAVGNDHEGYEMKIVVQNWLMEQGYAVKSFGANSPFSESYPDFIPSVAGMVNEGEYDFGILICGNGKKISFDKNIYNKVVSALCWSKEISVFEREHNHANILCLPGKLLSDAAGIGIIKSFIETTIKTGKSRYMLDKVSMTG